MNEHFCYTLAPYCRMNPFDKNATEIDLNVSSDFSVLFRKDDEKSDLRQFQKKRLEFIMSHPKEFDLIAHMLRQIRSEAEYTSHDLELNGVYHNIVSGKYGDYPVDFFRNSSNGKIQKMILYYLVQKNHYHTRRDYYEKVMEGIFQKEVTFYYDRIKKVLYVSLTADGTKENVKAENICRYFFADLLLDIRVRWRNYPVVIDRTVYLIASEGEQLCSTLV